MTAPDKLRARLEAMQPGGSSALTVAEWSLRLGCHPETLRLAIRQGNLLAKVAPLTKGSPYVITPQDMAAFLEKRSITSKAKRQLG